MYSILVVNDNTDKRRQLIGLLTGKDYVVSGTDTGQTTAQWLKTNKPDIAFCKLPLSDMTGIQLLGKIKELHPETIVIFTSSHSTNEVVELVSCGAYDCITEPLVPGKISAMVKDALLSQTMKAPGQIVPGIKSQGSVKYDNTDDSQYVTGNSAEFAEIIRQVNLVGPTNFSVIIYGKSGSGKEAIARQIHQKSQRVGKPFVAIDCGALSRELSGSELFGHEKGSFTGALNQKKGSLEIANGGTVFLDEVANLPYEVQVSLLRVVQERKIRRIGGISEINIDVRIIVASNVNLCDAAGAGKFREDLYHRFNEFTIALPSLNERKQDIMLLAHYFLKQTNIELGKRVVGFTKEVEKKLINYTWQGNIRELKNVIKRATLLTAGDFVEVSSLPFEINNYFKQHIAPAEAKSDSPKKITGTLLAYQLQANSTNLYLGEQALPHPLQGIKRATSSV